MAALSSLFPSYTPQLSNKLWFNCESSATISSDAELQKEEEQYNANLKEEVDIKLTTVGQTKEETEQTGNIYVISIRQDCCCSSSGSNSGSSSGSPSRSPSHSLAVYFNLDRPSGVLIIQVKVNL